MKRHLYLLLLIPVIIFALNGCGNKVQNNETEVTLQLNGFPYDITTYDLKVFIRKDTQLLKVCSYTSQSVTEEFNEKISVDPTATSLTAYLYSDTAPKYFAYFDYISTQKTYSSSYWINYDLYFDNGTVDFGISEGIAHQVASSYDGSIDFSKNFYGLFKVTNVTGQSISINISSPGNQVYISCSSNLEDINYDEDYSYLYSYNNFNKFVATCQTSVYYIYIRPKTLTAPLPTAQVSICCLKQVSVTSRIIDMVAGSTPDVVYAVDSANEIYSINPVTKAIGPKYSLSVTPVALAFSSVDNLLYILDASYGKFQIWNPALNTSVNVVTFGSGSYGDYGRKIQVAPNNNRIYALIDDKLYVIDKNSYNPISNIAIPNANYMAVYENGTDETIFISRSSYPYTIDRYSFSSGSFSPVQATRNNSGSSTKLIISPDKTKLVVPDYGVSGYVNAYDPNNLAGTPLGQWAVGDYPKVACFSPDSSIIYNVNADTDYYDGELVIDVLDAENYSLIRKLGLPNADSYPLITTNQDGSELIAISGYYSNNLYFYENIKKTSLTQSSRIYPLNIKAIRSKVNAAILRLEKN